MVVGLWRFENGSYLCYRMFRILSPFYTCYVGRDANKDIIKFLYKGDNNQLFYITKGRQDDGRKNTHLNFIDLAAAMTDSEK